MGREDSNHEALNPGATNQGFDFAFASVERMFVAFLGEKFKTVEVAKAIVDDAHNLAGEWTHAIARRSTFKAQRPGVLSSFSDMRRVVEKYITSSLPTKTDTADR